MNANTSIKNKIKEKSIEIGLSSTFIGLPNIIRNENKCLKIMWLILFLFGSSGGIYTVIKAINDYLDYEVVTSIKVFNEIPAKFPAVTFYLLRNNKANTSLNEILFQCYFNSLKCNSSDFDTIQDKFGYISYKFKSKQSFIDGSFYGLVVYLNLTNIPFYNNTYSLDGLKLMIHNDSIDPGYYAGALKKGLYLATGQWNDIVVKKIFTNKLGEPYNDCIKDVKSIHSYDSDLFRYIIQSTNYSYRQTDCFDYCIGRQIYKRTNITNKIDHWLNLVQNSTSKLDFVKEYIEVIKKQTFQFCLPDCPLECDSVKYEAFYSFTKFERNNSFNVKVDDYVVFGVYFDSLDYTLIDQIPKMNMLDLISNIGGSLGLFIGVSFLSFAEIIELFIEILFILKNFNLVNNLNNI
jgi:hypothetical protein